MQQFHSQQLETSVFAWGITIIIIIITHHPSPITITIPILLPIPLLPLAQDVMTQAGKALEHMVCCRGCGVPLQTHDPNNVGPMGWSSWGMAGLVG